MEYARESGDPASMSPSPDVGERQGSEQEERSELESYCFSKRLITFALYGKIHPKSKRPWNETLSAKIAEVQESFKNIPSMLYFSPSSVSVDGIGVYSAEPLPKATSLGPYFGRTVLKDQVEGEKHNKWLWEVYQDSAIMYFVDASDPKYGNWMNFIQCARSRLEQNLKALQHNECLFFEATRDIAAGEELLVWYDEVQYSLYMGIPTGYNRIAERSHIISKGFVETPGSTMFTETQPVNEDEFPNCSTPITSHNVCDTSSASTEDSGVSLTFEPMCTTTNNARNTTQLAERHVSPLRKVVERSSSQVPMEVTTSHTHSDNSYTHQQALSENMLHSTTLVDQQSDKTVENFKSVMEKGNSAFQDVSQWHPATNGSTTPPKPSPAPSSPTQQQTASARSTLNSSTSSSSKQKSSNLLYGMFSRSEDGTRWQCEECKRLFNSQGSLRAHARIHTGERPYQCQYCYRTFCQASTLRSHERLHTGEKPYKCEHCGRAFTQSAGLRSHLKTHRYDS